MGQGMSGTKLLTASGEVASAGASVRVYSIVALSGGTAGSSTFKTGGSGGTTQFTATCSVVSTDNIFYFGTKGMLFVNGCYWTKDSNTTNVKVNYEVEMT